MIFTPFDSPDFGDNFYVTFISVTLLFDLFCFCHNFHHFHPFLINYCRQKTQVNSPMSNM